ncbi:uncharacterized protein [Physcomitrium patens]|uniref:uncharacterized protein isoform X1 n=1 Tax=Physcomitrium patens TaxID=3218 RepID=UPI000D176BF2|nr:uncharacterized protein LOC112293540 [Physcomitrium patens]|eukprot:XP_024398852.1 uncharacterized protein LOC112293540 [Physcomitrella patens]
MTRFLFNVLNCSYTSTSFRQLKCWICCIIAARCEQPFSYHVSITMLVFEQADTISFVRQWIISLYERSFIKAGVEQVVLCLHIIREANQEISHVEQLKMKLFKGFTGNVMRVPKRMRIDLEYNNIICN